MIQCSLLQHMLASRRPLNHPHSLQTISKDSAEPESDSTVSHKPTSPACVCSASRWSVLLCACMHVCVCGSQTGDVDLYSMHGCTHEHVLSSACVPLSPPDYNIVASCIFYTFTVRFSTGLRLLVNYEQERRSLDSAGLVLNSSHSVCALVRHQWQHR